MEKTQPTVVFDKNAPGGRKVMDLPSDFQEVIECAPDEPIEGFLARHSPLTANAIWLWVRPPTQSSISDRAMDERKFQARLN